MNTTTAAYDPQAINAGVNLVEVAGQAVPLQKVSGQEYAGPCPKCGGKDRFHVTPTWAFCRQCWPLGEGLPHDAIGFVRWRDNLAFLAACEALGGEKTAPQGPRAAPSPTNRPPVEQLPQAAAPCDLWQGRARAFVSWAELQLWGDPQALAYLRGRGLRDDTIRAAHLGYCPKAYRDKAAAWGLDPAEYKKGVYIPLGWVIPCEAGGVLQYVKVRRPDGDPKYLALAGSHKAGAIYGLDLIGGAYDLVICEGEISALSLRQELAGVAAVVSVGDAGNRPTAAALAILATVPRWWSCFDLDTAGLKGAAWWDNLSARVRFLKWPWADRGNKYDANDALRDGEDLAAWAVPQLGPTDTAKRWFWAVHWLRGLVEAGGDESEAAKRTRRALTAEYLNLFDLVGDLGGDPQGEGHLNGGKMGDPQGAGAFDSPVGEDLAGDPEQEEPGGERLPF